MFNPARYLLSRGQIKDNAISQRQMANFNLLMAPDRTLIGYEIDEKEVNQNEIDEKEIDWNEIGESEVGESDVRENELGEKENDPKKDNEKKNDGTEIDRNRNEGVADHVGRG